MDHVCTLRPQEEVVQEINLLLPTPNRGETHLEQPDQQAFHVEMDDAEDIVTRVAQLRQQGERWDPEMLRREIGDVLGQSRSAFWKGVSADELMTKIAVL